MNKTTIGWTDYTWNTTFGCTHVSAGCKNCYAEALALRFGHSKHPWTKPYEAENVKVKPEKLKEPFSLRQPGRVFVDSMSDLFHPLVPAEHVAKVFAVMAATPHLTYQILTKRPERMCQLLVDPTATQAVAEAADELAGDWGWCHIWGNNPEDFPWPLPNVWLGTSVEDNRVAARVADLCATPAAVRFVSAEPLIGPVDLVHWLAPPAELHWVIAGGESGPNRRPMDLFWLEELARQCAWAGVPIFVKQDSDRMPERQGRIPDELWARKEFPAVGARQEAMAL
jgi:protein gp37